MKQFAIQMTLTYRSTVTVEADDEEQALAKAQAVEFVDDGMSGAELTDWAAHGRPQDVS